VRILVVDAGAADREILTTHLRKWQIAITGVENSPLALQSIYHAQACNLPFSIIFIDMQIPGMDGEALGRAIRACNIAMETQLVMLIPPDVDTNNELSGHLTDIGFNAFLTKPILFSELETVLFQLLANREFPSGRAFPDTSSSSPSLHAPLSQLAHHTPTPHDASFHSNALSHKEKATFFNPYLRILLVEDNPTNQQVALGVLGKFGLSADSAFNGKEAIWLMEEVSYNLIIMDVQMPEMDGLETTRYIRNPESSVLNHQVPIVALTAHALTGDREKCLMAGMDAYLTKPLNPRLLMAELIKWLGKKELGDLSCGSSVKKIPRGFPSESHLNSGFDRQKFLDLMDGDEELAVAVSRIFLDKTPEYLTAIRALMEQGDTEKMTFMAHKIKGSAANMTGEALKEAAWAMEKAGSRGDVETLVKLMPVLERQFMVLKKILELELKII